MQSARVGESRRVLVTGGTGYIGGRLAPRLLDAGFEVVCVARSVDKLRTRAWSSRPHAHLAECDLEDGDGIEAAMRGCAIAFYLVHSMVVAGGGYAARDRQLARTFGRAAARAGVGRIVYLGGLGEEGAHLSGHLASRREVEGALAAGGTPVTTFRAAMIIGSGSVSFEILRYLVERLPVMVTPRWVQTPNQPIAIGNVLHYLVRCLDVPETAGSTFDIGGPDVLSYRELMQTMAEALGLRRRVIFPVPVLTPRLSSLWIHLVTPISKHIARPLAEGLRNPVVCREDRAAHLMPQRLVGVREAIEEATRRTAARDVETSWIDAGTVPGDPDWAGGTSFADSRSVEVAAPVATAFATVCRVGGRHGWFGANALWRIRGIVDRLAGGPGLRRGRRDPERLAYGDAVDFWRVCGIEPERELRLRAEMRLPGVGELDFRIESRGGGCLVTQTARFLPRGLGGLAYWFAMRPAHAFVFGRMIDGIRAEAERSAGSGPSSGGAGPGQPTSKRAG